MIFTDKVLGSFIIVIFFFHGPQPSLKFCCWCTGSSRCEQHIAVLCE